MNLASLQEKIKTRCVFFTDENPGVLAVAANGAACKWLVDLRSLLLEPENLSFVAEQFWEIFAGRKKLQVAGLELASVPLMTAIIMVASKHGCDARAIIVRKSRKKYGLQKRFEGDFDRSVETIIVDDSVNSGSSILKCLAQLNEVGVNSSSVFSVLEYENASKKKFFESRGIAHHFLLTLKDVLVHEHDLSKIDLTGFATKFCFQSPTKSSGFNVFCKSNPVVDSKNVYFGTDQAVFYALDKKTGDLSWKFEGVENESLKGIWSSACIVGDAICVGCYDGNLYLLNRETGALVWMMSYANFIGSSPCYVESLGLIFIGLEFAFPGKKGSIAAVDAKTGEMVWQHDCHLHVHSSPTYSSQHGIVFCGSNDSDMLALDALTGRLIWRQPLRGICKMRPVLSEDQNVLYATSNDGRTQAIEVATGRLVWYHQSRFGILATPLLFQDKLIVGGLDNIIYILSTADGSVIKQFRTDGRIMSEPNCVDGKIYIGNNAGAVLEIDLGLLEITGRYQLPDRVVAKVEYCADIKRFYARTSDDRLFSFERM